MEKQIKNENDVSKGNPITPKPKRSPKKPKKDNGNRKDRLACWFYSLAITYYIIQLIEKVSTHVNLPVDIDLTSFNGSMILDNLLQCITIFVVLFKFRK